MTFNLPFQIVDYFTSSNEWSWRERTNWALSFSQAISQNEGLLHNRVFRLPTDKVPYQESEPFTVLGKKGLKNLKAKSLDNAD